MTTTQILGDIIVIFQPKVMKNRYIFINYIVVSIEITVRIK